MGHQLAGGNSSWCPELEQFRTAHQLQHSFTTRSPMIRPVGSKHHHLSPIPTTLYLTPPPPPKRTGSSLCTCLYTRKIHKRQVHFQSLD